MAMRLSGRGARAGSRARREQWQPVLARKDAQDLQRSWAGRTGRRPSRRCSPPRNRSLPAGPTKRQSTRQNDDEDDD